MGCVVGVVKFFVVRADLLLKTKEHLDTIFSWTCLGNICKFIWKPFETEKNINKEAKKPGMISFVLLWFIAIRSKHKILHPLGMRFRIKHRLQVWSIHLQQVYLGIWTVFHVNHALVFLDGKDRFYRSLLNDEYGTQDTVHAIQPHQTYINVQIKTVCYFHLKTKQLSNPSRHVNAKKMHLRTVLVSRYVFGLEWDLRICSQHKD